MKIPEAVKRELVVKIAKQAIQNADCFGTGKITAVKEALELNDIKLKDFQIESIVAQLIF